MYSLIISFIVANCVLTVFNKDNDDDDDDIRFKFSHPIFSEVKAEGRCVSGKSVLVAAPNFMRKHAIVNELWPLK